MEVQSNKGRRKNSTVTLVVAIVGTILTAALFIFNQNARGYEYYLVGNLLALGFVPMLVIFLLGEDPRDFGFGIGHSRKMLRWVLVLYAALLIILIPASRMSDFQGYYPIFSRFGIFRNGPRFVLGDPWALAYGWASYGMYMFFWEYYFRGFLLFGLARSLKWGAVIVQAIPFFILHWGKEPLEFAASLPAGIILGMLAMRSKSFFPCFLLHWAAQVTFDILVLIARRGGV